MCFVFMTVALPDTPRAPQTAWEEQGYLCSFRRGARQLGAGVHQADEAARLMTRLRVPIVGWRPIIGPNSAVILRR